VLDKDGRRLFPAHRAWLQLRPGEIRRCGGCHQPAGGRDLSHGRDGTSTPVPWSGAASSAMPFPNTRPQAAANALAGDTMAQARARTTCVAGTLCSQLPSVNLIYDDVWTNPAVRPADASFAYTYGAASGFTTAAPVRASCMTTWTSTCRIVINYVQHIHPLWSVDRGANTCTNCHGPVNAADNTPRLPSGQLDLSDGDSQQEPLHKNAYEELLSGDNQQELVGGVLQDVLVPGVDDQGNPILVPVPVPASLQPGSARASARFFARFADGSGTFDHRNTLTPAELRLVSEWVDIGAQYFNNPFDPAVPLN
jgi:hypothetical protein